MFVSILSCRFCFIFCVNASLFLTSCFSSFVLLFISPPFFFFLTVFLHFVFHFFCCVFSSSFFFLFFLLCIFLFFPSCVHFSLFLKNVCLCLFRFCHRVSFVSFSLFPTFSKTNSFSSGHLISFLVFIANKKISLFKFPFWLCSFLYFYFSFLFLSVDSFHVSTPLCVPTDVRSLCLSTLLIVTLPFLLPKFLHKKTFLSLSLLENLRASFQSPSSFTLFISFSETPSVVLLLFWFRLFSSLHFPSLFFRRITFLSSFFFSKKKRISLMKNNLSFFFHQMFLASFFHHFLFLSITFRIHHCFSFPFLLDVFIFLNSFFLSSVSLPSLSLVFWIKISLPFCIKIKPCNCPFYMHSLPLYVPLLFIHLFICCLLYSRFYHICFPFFVLVSSLKLAFGTSAIFCLLFVGHFWPISAFSVLSSEQNILFNPLQKNVFWISPWLKKISQKMFFHHHFHFHFLIFLNVWETVYLLSVCFEKKSILFFFLDFCFSPLWIFHFVHFVVKKKTLVFFTCF